MVPGLKMFASKETDHNPAKISVVRVSLRAVLAGHKLSTVEEQRQEQRQEQRCFDVEVKDTKD
jgi:hypothetical protein